MERESKDIERRHPTTGRSSTEGSRGSNTEKDPSSQATPRGGMTRGSSRPSFPSPRDLLTSNPFELMRHYACEMDRMFDRWGHGRDFGWPAIEMICAFAW